MLQNDCRNLQFIHAGKHDTTETQISFQGNRAVVLFTALQNLVLNIAGETSCGLDHTIASRWYQNGNSLPLGVRLGPLTRSCLNISQSLTLEHSSILDVGVYDTLLTIDSYTHFVSHLGCPNNYYTFVDSTVGVNDIILAKATLQLKYYGMLSQWHSPVYSSFYLYLFLLQSTPCLP